MNAYSQWMMWIAIALIAAGLLGMRAQAGRSRFWAAMRVRMTWKSKRLLRRMLGKPVQVLPKNVVIRNGRPVTIKDRHYV